MTPTQKQEFQVKNRALWLIADELMATVRNGPPIGEKRLFYIAESQKHIVNAANYLANAIESKIENE